MKRIIFKKIVKRLIYGIFLIFLSYIFNFLKIQKILLNIKIPNTILDFIYVLFVSFLPSFIYWSGIGILFSIGIMLLKYLVLPTHVVEKHYLGIRKGNFTKSLIICIILSLLIFGAPFLFEGSPNFSGIVGGIDNTLIGSSNFLINNYNTFLGPILPILGFMVIIVDYLLIKPLYIFSGVRFDAFLSGLFFSIILYHSLIIGLTNRYLKIERTISKRFSQEGERVILKTTLSFLPAPNLFLSGKYIKGGKNKIKSKEDFSCSRFEIKEEMQLKQGYYNFDIIPIHIFTFPFLYTKIYKVSKRDCDVFVLPKLKYKIKVPIKTPVVSRETGSLIKRQLGSSLDFAGLREYTREDPLTRIWWKGYAKYNKLLVKQFHSFAEDRWMLVLDFTNSGMETKKIAAVLQFARLFVELCTRKDISIGLSSFSPSFYFTDYQIDKKKLLSSLTKVTTPLYEISPKGIELILKDGLGKKEFEILKAKCKKRNMSLSTIYFSSGFGRESIFFSWRRERVFKNSLKEFFIKLNKSGKIVLITDGKFKNMDVLRKFKGMCETKRCNYIIVITEKNKHIINEVKKARIKHIFSDYENIVKPGFIINLVGLF